MKNYTAIYSTESIKNFQYSFDSENLESALGFCSYKFSCFPNIILVEHPEGFTYNEGKGVKGVVVWANGYEVK